MNYRERKRQRKKERIQCNIVLKINNSILCNAFDISEGGMYVLTDQSFKPGTVIKISLLFRHEILEIQSKVKYCHEGVGIGIMFIDLDNEMKDKIKELVNDIKQLT
jgi:Tfp pilus assembly protein PilZ